MSIALAAVSAQAQTKAVDAPNPVALVDALNGTFGKHAGKRASHAKGFCAAGDFTPDAQAAKFVHSPLFQGGTIAANLRFSIGGGNPGVSDKARAVRGLAVRMSAGDEAYDLVLISEPVFFAATPESFVSFLQARVADPATRKPDPAKVAAHNAAYPDGKLQPALLASHAAPASYATTPYYSNNAFVFEGADGKKQHARIVVEPSAGTHYLSEEAEKTLPDLFLEDELSARIKAAPAEFTIYAQLPAPTDSLTDPSQQWTGAGRVALGRLRVNGHAEQDACDGIVYMPVNLPRAITPSADPILLARAGAYAVSLSRRSQK